jgi:hypothetical protein
MLSLRPILPLKDKANLLLNDLILTENRMHRVTDIVIVEFSFVAVDKFAALTSELEDSVLTEEFYQHR